MAAFAFTNYFVMPMFNLMGPGCLQEVGAIIASRGLKKALIVTDRGMVDIGLVGKLTEVLDRSGLPYVVYDGTVPNPTTTNVEEGLLMLQDKGCDYLISMGGGSSHDCAKAIGVVAANGGRIADYIGINNEALKLPARPVIAVNTTAGTSAEVSLGAVISDTETHVKLIVGSPLLMPVVSVNDPELMLGLPPKITAATGMDCLTHAAEAYVSSMSTPVTDGCAIKAIELIGQNLETAVKDGQNIEARTNMVYAVFCAGMALNNALAGQAHSLAHAVGGQYDLPHGMCCGMALPEVLKFYMGVCDKKLADIARALGGDDRPEDAAKAVRDLGQRIGLPKNLSELGVDASALDKLADLAIEDMSGATSPKIASRDELRGMFSALL